MANKRLGQIYQTATVAASLTTPFIFFNTGILAYQSFWQRYVFAELYILGTIIAFSGVCLFVSTKLLPSSTAFSISLWEDVDNEFVNRMKRIEKKLDNINESQQSPEIKSETQNETKK